MSIVTLENQDSDKAAAIGETPDHEIILGCKQGDRDAQYALYQKYKNSVFNTAFRMCNHQQTAEDITQTTFLRVFRKIDSFRGEAAFSSWLYRITVNVCMNHFRKEKGKKNTLAKGTVLEDDHQQAMKANDEKINLKPHLEKAIAALPAGYRMVFLLHDVQGYNHSEIAQMMQIAVGTSKSQLHKARMELRRVLEPYLLIHRAL